MNEKFGKSDGLSLEVNRFELTSFMLFLLSFLIGNASAIQIIKLNRGLVRQ